MVPTSKSKPTEPPTLPTTTTSGAAERGMSVPRARGALAGGRQGGVRGDGGGGSREVGSGGGSRGGGGEAGGGN
eukprot:scaffold92810_cov63-Phaeocystis_antarctica.AAC.1